MPFGVETYANTRRMEKSLRLQNADLLTEYNLLEADLADAANLMLAELGRPARTQAEIHSFVGKGIPNLVRRCMTEATHATESEIDAAVAVFRRHYAAVNGVRTTIYPGVVETLQTLRARDIRLAVVTNKAEAFTLPLLERMAIAHYFDAVVSGDTLPVKKPNPAAIHACLKDYGVPAARALFVGDSSIDVATARNGGIAVWALPYGYNMGEPIEACSPDRVIADVSALLDTAVVD